MATFQILEDDENFGQFKVCTRNGDKHEVGLAKKEPRPVLQPYNKIEQESKRIRLCNEKSLPQRFEVVEKKQHKTEILKSEVLKNAVLKNGVQKNEVQKNAAQKNEVQKNAVQKNEAHKNEAHKQVKKQEEEVLDVELLKLETQDFQIKNKEEKVFPIVLSHAKEYQSDIWYYLLEMEQKSQQIKPNYMLKQTSINWSTRSILVDWLASVSDEYKLGEETFHLGINYIDRFLSRISVVREKLQLLGASAMMLAGKVEEIYPIETAEWSYLTGDSFEVRQLLKMEQLILKVLRFGMQPPTAYGFLEHMCTLCDVDDKTKHLAMFIIELVLVEGDDYLNHQPSKLASAAFVLARHTLAKQPLWPEEMKQISGYTLKHLSPVVQRQNKTFRDSPHKKEQSVQTKYKRDKFNKVALLKPKVLDMNEFDEDN